MEDERQDASSENETLNKTEHKTSDNPCAETNIHVSVAVQADDEDIEGSFKLPNRKRIIPVKFKEYANIEEDYEDEDYVPSDEESTSERKPKGNGKRGRPRKIPKKDCSEEEDGDDSNQQKSESDKGDCQKEFVQYLRVIKELQAPWVKKGESKLKSYVCPDCGRVFTQRGNLNVHLRIHRDERPFPCETCDKSFRSKEALRRHTFSHQGIKPYKCDVCELQFASNVALKEHMSLHTNEKPLQCDFCDKRFRQRSCLHRHLLTHSQSAPKYVCRLCAKQFTQNSYLKSHMKSHTGERPFVCPVCTKAFAHRSDLNRHRTVHSGEKPYACTICYARFSDPSSRRRHNKEHEGEKPYTCQLCNEGFKRSGQLKVHLSKTHEGEEGQGVSGDLQYIYNRQENQLLVLHEALTANEMAETHNALANIEGARGSALGGESFVVQDGVAVQANSVSQPTVEQDQPADIDATTLVIGEQLAASDVVVEEAGQDAPDGGVVQVYQIIETVDETTGAKSQQVLEVQYATVEELSQLTGEAVTVDQSLVLEPQTQNQETSGEGQEDNESCPIGETCVHVVPYTMDNEPLNNVDDSSQSEKGCDTEEITVSVDMEQTDTTGGYVICHAIDAEDSSDDTNKIDAYNESPLIVGEKDSNDRQEREENNEDVEVEITATENKSVTACLNTQETSAIDIEDTNFVTNPDFENQDYYNWLSNFVEVCKLFPVPLENDHFQKISQVHKTLSDNLASPSGILAIKENFKILMNISKELNEIVNKHLSAVLQQLDG